MGLAIGGKMENVKNVKNFNEKNYEGDDIPPDVANEMVRQFVQGAKWHWVEEVWQAAEQLIERKVIFHDEGKISVNPKIDDWLLNSSERAALFKTLITLKINLGNTLRHGL